MRPVQTVNLGRKILRKIRKANSKFKTKQCIEKLQRYRLFYASADIFSVSVQQDDIEYEEVKEAHLSEAQPSEV